MYIKQMYRSAYLRRQSIGRRGQEEMLPVAQQGVQWEELQGDTWYSQFPGKSHRPLQRSSLLQKFTWGMKPMHQIKRLSLGWNGRGHTAQSEYQFWIILLRSWTESPKSAAKVHFQISRYPLQYCSYRWKFLP